VPNSAASLQRHFGDSLRAERKQRGLTQLEISSKARLSLTYIGEIERGKRMISLDTLRRLAGALDLTSSELLTRVGL
jgi:transcriptional regulator with XRE-family HTH domain